MKDQLKPLLLDYDDAALMLGITTQALRDKIYKGQGPRFVKDGRRRFFRPADLETWVNNLPSS